MAFYLYCILIYKGAMLITETIMVEIGIFIFAIYNLFFTSLNKWKLPESISATSYLSKENYNTTWPFTMICIVSVVCLFPLWIAVSPVIWQFLVFLSCAGILFAGSTPLYKEKFESRIHYTGGIIAFVSGLLWLTFTSNWVSLITIGLIGGLFTIFNKKSYTFIFEIISYITICITVLSM